jgi:predicted dinucleotide-binding enzyme
MRYGVLGTGIVGPTIAEKLTSLGHDVMIGTRDPEEAKARTTSDRDWVPPFGEWHRAHPEVGVGAFAEAAAHGEIVVNATNGHASLPALEAAGSENLDGKVLIDISNPLDFSQGMPPFFFVANTDSLGEQIQRAHPGARVVKTLHTVAARVMVEPGEVGGGDHTMVLCGDDPEAKAEVTRLLTEEFGWREVIDLGDITNARGTEALVALWVRLVPAVGTAMFNIKVVR